MLDRARAKLESVLRRIIGSFGEPFLTVTIKQVLLRQEFAALQAQMRVNTPDNPALAGYKVFSQADEDGIIAEIFRRIGSGGKVFVEIGCGNGIENNTHTALLQGWRGTWVDGSEEFVAEISQWIPLDSAKLQVRRQFVTLENVNEIVESTQQRYGVQELDLFSMDIDGNDLYMLQRVLEKFKPRLIIAEYNGKFPPPISLTITYDANHVWAADDYMGASLQALVDGLDGYRLVACNLAGTNAFFVRDDLAGAFQKYSIQELYQPTRYYLTQLLYGERPSMKMLRMSLAKSSG